MATVNVKRWSFLALGSAIFALDQWTKYPFRTSWQVGQSQPLNPFLALTYVQNTGSLFGMFQGHPYILGTISCLVAIGIIVYAWRLPKNSGWLPYITLGFLWGGATGNMYDRLFHGFVVDFFDIQWYGKNIWAVFNVADIAVDVAIGLFILMAFLDPGDKADKDANDLQNEDAPIPQMDDSAQT